MPPAQYIVNANGFEKSFELVTQDLTKFGQTLVDALNARNFDTVKVMMDQSLIFAFWQSQGTSYTPDQAVEQLQTNYLGTTPLTADANKDLNALLNGTDPYSIVGLDPNKSQALFVSGWGLDGKDEAILYSTKLADGSLYWHSVLIAKGGFTPDSGSISHEAFCADTRIPALIEQLKTQHESIQRRYVLCAGQPGTWSGCPLVGICLPGELQHNKRKECIHRYHCI